MAVHDKEITSEIDVDGNLSVNEKCVYTKKELEADLIHMQTQKDNAYNAIIKHMDDKIIILQEQIAKFV